MLEIPLPESRKTLPENLLGERPMRRGPPVLQADRAPDQEYHLAQ